MEAQMKAEILSAAFLLPLLVALGPSGAGSQERPREEMILTVLFDNLTDQADLQTGWGFAALLETPDHTVLFDTGADGQVLLENMRKLGKDPSSIEAIVISHNHGDHTGGMAALLNLGIQPRLYVLQAFGAGAIQAFAGGLDPILAMPGDEIVPGIRTTGVVGEAIPEQAVVLDTRDGPMVLTGCAHPGAPAMAARGAEIAGQAIYGIMGGFHLFQASEEEVEDMIQTFRTQGIVKVGATHCTGPEAMAAFAEAYGDDYVPLGVGRVIRLPLS